MNLTIHAAEGIHSGKTLCISGSKSESNRLLVLQALYPGIILKNLGDADDIRAMQEGLDRSKDVVDVGHAGTTMRFLTAYFASSPGRTVLLTGSARMQQRPIGVLVNALRQLGADITYTKNEGYPPMMIRGRSLSENQVTIPANISSQYISALILIAARLPEGLTLALEGQITSRPYIEMTLSLLGRIGFTYTFKGNEIHIPPQDLQAGLTLTVESDWSSASYYYSLIAFSDPGTEIRLQSYYPDSLQGDRAIADIYAPLGVTTAFENGDLVLRKLKVEIVSGPELDLQNTPDLAQTLAVTCFGLGIPCRLRGLHTLKIKETDRLIALQTELGKLGATVHVTEDTLELEPARMIKEGIAIDTYHDHRMAMAFAPLALRKPITINDAAVVSKSYPNFWEHLDLLGVKQTRI